MLPELLVMDWGIGGFGVVKELRRQHPRAGLAYFSDSGFLPYGKLSAAALVQRLELVLSAFFARGVRRVVIACNAASTVAPWLKLPEGLIVHDVITPGVALVQESKLTRIGLIGGVRTVRSGAHRRRLAQWGIEVVGRIAQPLSAYVEAGELSSPRVVAEVSRVVQPLVKLPGLLLACTHYPALLPIFCEALPKMRFFDPAAYLVQELLRGAAIADDSRLVVFTSGDPQIIQRSAPLAFGVAVPSVFPFACQQPL